MTPCSLNSPALTIVHWQKKRVNAATVNSMQIHQVSPRHLVVDTLGLRLQLSRSGIRPGTLTVVVRYIWILHTKSRFCAQIHKNHFLISISCV